MMNGYEYTGMDAILAGSFRAAIYCRLSKDDDLDGESASIANQRDMLESYCEKQGWEVVAVYQDDGFTGLNMERPDLQVGISLQILLVRCLCSILLLQDNRNYQGHFLPFSAS